MSTVYAPTKASTTPTQAAVRDKSRSDAWRDRPVKREWTRNESEALMSKNLMIREEKKQSMFEQRLQHQKLIQSARDDREELWKLKTKRSPFAVNLIAEDERITEEISMRVRQETDLRTKLEAGKMHATNQLVLKALSESSELEALRREKREIMDEEQRLIALLALEKVCDTTSIAPHCSTVY
jgi:hypothetical protein